MTQPAPAAVGQIRHVQRNLADARDEQIVRVVAMVDRLAERGAADSLIAPLRGRLAQLRPTRALNFTRLLFLPLDPIIMVGRDWRRGCPGLPRTVLTPFAQIVRTAMGGAAERMQERIDATPGDRIALTLELGRTLWPQASRILAAAPMPEDWTAATGLQPADHAQLAHCIATLLSVAPRLQALATVAAMEQEPQPEELAQMLSHAASAGAAPLAMLAVLMMARLPRPDRVMAAMDELAARQTDPASRAAADLAIDFVLDGIEATPPSANLPQAVDELHRSVTMLSDMGGRATHRPARRDRVEQVRRRLDSDCRDRFRSELDSQLLEPAANLSGASDQTVAMLEATARDLRRFEAAARHLGGADQYNRALRQAAAALSAPSPPDASSLIDRVRLVEILQGPEAAMALLRGGE